MVDLPIHDKVSGCKVTWKLNLLNTIHVKMPTEHANWLCIIILKKSSTIYGRPMKFSHLELTYLLNLLMAGKVSSDNTP